MSIGTDNQILYVCDFCGSHQFEQTSCSGCGGLSLSQVNNQGLTEKRNFKKLNVAVKAHNRLKVVMVALAMGFIVVTTVLFKPQTHVEKFFQQISGGEYSEEEIYQKLHNEISEPYEFVVAKIRKSSGPDRTTQVHLQRNANPIVLVLVSHDAVTWRFSNPNKVNVLAVIYGSHEKGASVTGDLEPSTLLLHHKGPIGQFFAKTQHCDCGSDAVRCPYGGLVSRAILLMDRFGSGILTGHTLRDTESFLRVPSYAVSAKQVHSTRQSSIRRQKECHANSNTAIDI